jgi:hypothetical protein
MNQPTLAIVLTITQEEAVDWAFSAMEDYWQADCLQGAQASKESEGSVQSALDFSRPAHMPFRIGNLLHLSNRSEINEDLHYRIAVQLCDIVRNNPDHSGNQKVSLIRTYNRLARQIERRIIVQANRERAK